MVKLFTVLLTLLIAFSFGGLTFAKSLGDQSSIQSTFPLGADDDKDDKDKKGDDQKMDDKKGDDDKEGEKGEK